MADLAEAPASYQAQFARRWGALRSPHVRALAWLLDAPDLLDVHDPHWQGRIASVAPRAATAAWLAAQDADPSALMAALGPRPFTRLGLYAEHLMAFYYRAHGMLVAHGLQVRASRNDTVGEFDFLLAGADGNLEHIELATKFYLREGDLARGLDTLVGPNLADSLGAKMRKIVERQLVLGTHPAAQAVLPRPVTLARALVKGWLFYPIGAPAPIAGIAPGHCRGYWCALDDAHQWARMEAQQFVVLPRLQWLAPYCGLEEVLDGGALHARLAQQFAETAAPVLVAQVAQVAQVAAMHQAAGQGGAAPASVPESVRHREVARAFIVPAGWRARAAAR